MKFVSIDIETTGLDPETCQILEFGAVIDDMAKPMVVRPQFHRYLRHKEIHGEAFALQMNHEILLKIAQPEKWSEYKFCHPEYLAMDFLGFLEDNHMETGKGIIAAGKNFAGFDKQFLLQLPGFSPKLNPIVRFKHRVLDPMMLYLRRSDIEPPNMDLCMERAGLKKSDYRLHTALGDAYVVADLLKHWHHDRDFGVIHT